VRAVKKTRKPKTIKATTIKAAHPQAKVAVDPADPAAVQALVEACLVAEVLVAALVAVGRAKAKECPAAPAEVNSAKGRAEVPVVVNLVKGRAETLAVVNSNPRS
jgi:hypothetical protein